MKLQFEYYQEGMGSELKCPSCGFNYIHHQKVEVFDRGEDDKNGLHVTIENGVAKTDINLSGNPSFRRHGLLIYFWCECCHGNSVLSLSQHKGNTWVDLK